MAPGRSSGGFSGALLTPEEEAALLAQQQAAPPDTYIPGSTYVPPSQPPLADPAQSPEASAQYAANQRLPYSEPLPVAPVANDPSAPPSYTGQPTVYDAPAPASGTPGTGAGLAAPGPSAGQVTSWEQPAWGMGAQPGWLNATSPNTPPAPPVSRAENLPGPQSGASPSGGPSIADQGKPSGLLAQYFNEAATHARGMKLAPPKPRKADPKGAPGPAPAATAPNLNPLTGRPTLDFLMPIANARDDYLTHTASESALAAGVAEPRNDFRDYDRLEQQRIANARPPGTPGTGAGLAAPGPSAARVTNAEQGAWGMGAQPGWINATRPLPRGTGENIPPPGPSSTIPFAFVPTGDSMAWRNAISPNRPGASGTGENIPPPGPSLGDYYTNGWVSRSHPRRSDYGSPWESVIPGTAPYRERQGTAARPTINTGNGSGVGNLVRRDGDELVSFREQERQLREAGIAPGTENRAGRPTADWIGPIISFASNAVNPGTVAETQASLDARGDIISPDSWLGRTFGDEARRARGAAIRGAVDAIGERQDDYRRQIAGIESPAPSSMPDPAMLRTTGETSEPRANIFPSLPDFLGRSGTAQAAPATGDGLALPPFLPAATPSSPAMDATTNSAIVGLQSEGLVDANGRWTPEGLAIGQNAPDLGPILDANGRWTAHAAEIGIVPPEAVGRPEPAWARGSGRPVGTAPPTEAPPEANTPFDPDATLPVTAAEVMAVESGSAGGGGGRRSGGGSGGGRSSRGGGGGWNSGGSGRSSGGSGWNSGGSGWSSGSSGISADALAFLGPDFMGGRFSGGGDSGGGSWRDMLDDFDGDGDIDDADEQEARKRFKRTRRGSRGGKRKGSRVSGAPSQPPSPIRTQILEALSASMGDSLRR